MSLNNLEVQKCGNCQFSVVMTNPKAINGTTQILVCRRYPPIFHPGDRSRREMSLNPPVYDTGWCGEWQPKGAPAPLPEIKDNRPLSERVHDIAATTLPEVQPVEQPAHDGAPPGH